MSNENYVLGTREPSGGDKAQGDKRTKDIEYSPSSSREEQCGEIRG